MRRMLSVALILTVLAGCQTASSRQVEAAQETPETAPKEASRTLGSSTEARDFVDWVATFRREARDQGIGESVLVSAFEGVRFQPRVIELDGAQPEFVRPIWSYLDTAVSATRIEQGRKQLAAHEGAASAAAQRYGVPKEILVAIWGIESNYGANFGGFSTIDALATLAFEGRRSEFAKQELMAALRILQAGDIDASRMRGSWAGAMGHTQFMPSSFEAYAVDGDADGHRDIWGSIPDVMASTAHYLDRAGWRAGEPWGVEVTLPQGFDYTQASAAIRRSSEQWASEGVAALNGRALPNFDEAAILVPAGASGPAFLVGPNFRAILRYNNATSYALAVGTLANRIAGRPGIDQQWPRDQKPLSRSQVRELQQLLNRQGYATGTPDGILGPNTRRGLRDYQRSVGLVPDGFATQALLDRLRG
ncbi:lytic murein transglycosylase [Pistricoccus aurantiacus]|uniref:Type IV secretion system putative lipoprotein virB7 n=1 Tax=Pistricoccus aurantiacus TaxID=1883414 RepID=A0A5B8SQY1_9GAMM|nr:lytic murein transglycosylase [Pistricoccus aurantiacus]QEA39076.1 lytic murein transglycosylase [Pistricoccus aurantiacus]